MSTTRSARRPGRLWVTTVRRVRDLTPRMRRVTVTSPGLSRFESNGTDQHVAIYFYDEDVVLPRPFTTEEARRIYPVAKPAMRRYTIRHARPEQCEVDLDFVLHPGDNLASDWAAKAREGDELIWFGPTPAYEIDSGASEFVLLGDETAIPAIAAILERMPESTPVRVHIEVSGPEEEQPLPLGPRTALTWSYRDGGPPGEALWRSVSDDSPPTGGAKVWGAAERGAVSRLRRLALDHWRLPRADVHLTAYWTAGERQDEDGD